MNDFDDLKDDAWTTLVLALLAAFPDGFTLKDWNEWVEQGLRLIEKEKNTPGGSL